MSTTKTTKNVNKTFINLCDDKIAELTKKIATTKTSDVLTKNTRGTQLYKLGRERRTVALIKELLTDNTTLSDASISTLNLLVTPTEQKIMSTKVICKEGDNLIDILEKYKDVKDVYNKLNKFCEQNGLKINGTTITKV